jgi:hypothetical protein
LQEQAKYVLRFFFEWGGGCLWPGNDASYRELELGPYDVLNPCPLPLSAETLERCRRMGEWHDTSLNWDCPPDPGPWRQSECDRFNVAVGELLAEIQRQLGSEFEVIDRQLRHAEDPDLDAYLADPKRFRRTQA